MSKNRNIFVIGFNEHQGELLLRMGAREGCAFHSLIHEKELLAVKNQETDISEMLQLAERRLQRFDGHVDGIIPLLDFPATEIGAMLAHKFGLRAPSLESVMKCSHKYWGRILQKEVVPDNVPDFAVFDPYAGKPGTVKVPLEFPYWIKPLNAFCSYLGFKIDREEDLRRVVPILRLQLPRLSDLLGFALERTQTPDRLRGLGPRICIAESFIGGHQCTLEGYVYRGDVWVYGVVDTIPTPNGLSFARYQYPAGLPLDVQARMSGITTRVMKYIEYEHGPFNIEFFYDGEKDQIWLLEVNPRISSSHCELFEKVDGRSNHGVAVDLALGRRPRMPWREGKFKVAGKFFLRSFGNGRVARMPGADTIRRMKEAIPGVSIEVVVEEGGVLSDRPEQDSYSYELAWIWLGADDSRELEEKYNQCVEMLGFKVEEIRDRSA